MAKTSCNLRSILIPVAMLIFSGKIMAQGDFSIEPPSKISIKKNVDSIISWQGLYAAPEFALGYGEPYSGGFKSGTVLDFGGEAMLMFPMGLGISVGAQFEQYSYRFRYNNLSQTTPVFTTFRSYSNDTVIFAGYNTSVTYTSDYVKIPVLLHYATGDQNHISFHIEAGIVANILVANKVSGNVNAESYNMSQSANTAVYQYSNTSTNTDNVSENNTDIAKLNFALHLGIGVMIPVTAGISFLIQYSPEFWLLNSGTGKNDMVTFGNTQYYFYGTGNYGSYNTEAVGVKMFFKIK